MDSEPDLTLRERFLEGMSRTASTVTVVTTDGVAGRSGVTVSAMSSVSADGERPTLLICVHHLSPTATAIVENGVFCVNVLQDHQADIADVFAGRGEAGGDKFSCAAWTTEITGSPRVLDPLVAFDCRVVNAERVGTHHVVIGEVLDVATARAGSPLIIARRAYGSTARLQAAPLQDLADHSRSRTNPMAHTRIRRFNTKDTYPEQKLDNDLCQAVVARGTMVFVRGQIGQDLETSSSVGVGDPVAQTRQAMRNIEMLLNEAGAEMAHLCRIVVYLTDIRHREAVYRTIGEHIKGVHPVSTGLVVTALARPEWVVEVEATAVIPDEG